MQLKVLWPLIVVGLLVGLSLLKRLGHDFWQGPSGQLVLRALSPVLGAVAASLGLDSSVTDDFEQIALHALGGAGMGACAPMLFHLGKGTTKLAKTTKRRPAGRKPRGV